MEQNNQEELRLLYSRKLSGEKTVMNFTALWLFAKVFSVKFGCVASFGVAKASNLRTFSQRKSYFSPIRVSFLPQKFPAIRYQSCECQYATKWTWIWRGGGATYLQTPAHPQGHCCSFPRISLTIDRLHPSCTHKYYYWTDC